MHYKQDKIMHLAIVSLNTVMLYMLYFKVNFSNQKTILRSISTQHNHNHWT